MVLGIGQLEKKLSEKKVGINGINSHPSGKPAVVPTGGGFCQFPLCGPLPIPWGKGRMRRTADTCGNSSSLQTSFHESNF